MSGNAVGRVLTIPSRTAATKETIVTLSKIWERVLDRSPIGPGESFYDLGGTDPLADRLFAEIGRVFNRQLPSATICHAPSIGELAPLLEQSALPIFSPFVPLKAGKNGPSILIAHGVGGRASFSELALRIRTENPVYGIQAKGVDGMEKPFAHIEDMADYYLDELRGLQPQDPYILIGYSFGGLVSLEMAQRLTERGKRIALLVLVDTYPHPRHLPPTQRLWLGAKRLNAHLSDMREKPLSVTLGKLLGALRRRLPISRPAQATALPAQTLPLSFAETTLRVKRNDFLAMKRYRPRFYPGKINFVRPEANSYLPNDPTAIWKHLAAEFELDTVPGDHLGMIATHFESLAAVLTRYVQEVSAE
jgi:thioesterase domain-containing protein